MLSRYEKKGIVMSAVLVICYLITVKHSSLFYSNNIANEKKEMSSNNEVIVSSNDEMTVSRDIEYESCVDLEENNLKIHAEVNVHGCQKVSDLKSGSFVLQDFDQNKALELLWKETEYNTEHFEGHNEFNEKVETVDYSDLQNLNRIGFGPKTCGINYYTGDFASYINASFRFEEDSDNNVKHFDKENDLNFMSRKDAEKYIIESLSKLGFDFEYKMNLFPLEYSKLKEEELHFDVDGNIDQSHYKDSWEKSDDCYYFFIRQALNGLPILNSYYEAYTSYCLANSQVQGVLSEDGYQELIVEKLFSVEQQKPIEKQCEFQQIISRFVDGFNSSDELVYVVNDIELIYLAVDSSNSGHYDFKPVWIFKGENSDGQPFQVMFDFETGGGVTL